MLLIKIPQPHLFPTKFTAGIQPSVLRPTSTSLEPMMEISSSLERQVRGLSYHLFSTSLSHPYTVGPNAPIKNEEI